MRGTMGKEFVIHRNEPGEVSPAGGITSTMRRVRGRAADLEPLFTIFVRGDSQHVTRKDKAAAFKVFKRKAKATEPGDVITLRGFRVRPGQPSERVDIEARCVSAPVALPEQAAKWDIDQRHLYSFVFSRWPNARWGGTCNCRPPRGQSSGYSDHACCRALDVFPVSKQQGDEIEREVTKMSSSFHLRYIAWQEPLHYDHLHIATGNPCGGCT